MNLLINYLTRKGYIPSRKFHFSDTYRTECDSCIGDFVSSRNEKYMKNNDIMGHVLNAPRLTKITSNLDLKREVDNFKDRNAPYNILKSKLNIFKEKY